MKKYICPECKVEYRFREDMIKCRGDHLFEDFPEKIELVLPNILNRLKEKAKDHLHFSKGLWESGDDPNAHYQEGRGDGINYAIREINKFLNGEEL